MSLLTSSLAQLSPEQRAVLEAKLLNKSRQPNKTLIIPKRDKTQPCSLSFAQQRLWFLEQLESGGAAYHITRTLRLRGPLDIDALQQSLTTIVERHESLRTYFVANHGIPQQVVIPLDIFELPCTDLSHLDPNQRSARLKTQLTEAVQHPFNLTQDLLLRASLWRLDLEEHVLQVVMHHIASDGWSMGIFTRELGKLYQSYAHGQPNPLPELPIQYGDFAQWQRQWMTGELLESQLNYWKQQLSGAPPLLELPTDYPRPPQASYRGAELTFTLSPALSEALKRLSQQTGNTLFMTLLAAFNTLLYRYTQQEDMVVGSPIANRNRGEIEGLIGFFANTLALRTNLSDHPSFRELLGRVRQVTLDAYAHQDLPLEKLVEELQPERSLSYSPLFQVMFALHNLPSSELQLTELSVENEPVEHRTAKFDLILSMREETGGLKGVFEYSVDLFERATIERMVGHFQTLLAGIVVDPEQSIATLPLLTETERHQLLVEWNQTQTDYPRDKCIHQLFEEQVERTPDAIAVVFEDQQLTYGELNHRANQVAYYLQKLGVSPGMLVGICVERSLEMVIGLLGILKAGGAYVPLDPTDPKERQAYILEDAQVTIVLTQQHLITGGASPGVQLIPLEHIEQTFPGEQSGHAELTTAASLAYVIYTSGSTGRPKGVTVNHRAVNRLVLNTNYLQLYPTDRVAQAANAAFDASTFEIWGALLNGAALVILAKSTVLTPQDLAAQLRQQGVSVLFLTTALLNQIATTLPQAFSGLRYLLFGGEAADPECVKAILTESRPQQLLHVYGPTENTTFSSWYPVESMAAAPPRLPIGRPIANSQMYLLDRQLQPVPVGVVGEILLGGEGLSSGYLHRPSLNAEKFVPNPFSSDPGDRLYRTGDLGRYLPDGNLEFIGRIDHQIKLRGFRIELGEIEAALGQHPTVATVIVLAREDEPGNKRLVAYWVATDAEVPTSLELRQFLQQTLPDYMIPVAFIQLDALPLTPNGKVDRRALPVPDQTRLEPGQIFVAPRDELESQLTKIWEQVLGLQPIGVRDNFFSLGGHSLLAIELLAQIEKTFEKSLPLATIFHAPTVEELAMVLGHQESPPSWSSLIPLQPEGSRPPLFGIHWLSYRDLSRHLGPDQPIYGMHLRGTGTGEQVPCVSTVEELASQYLEEILRFQPKGPYLLMGFSFGGIVAYEIAQQLIAQGRQVALLALFDSCLYSKQTAEVLPLTRRLTNILRLSPDEVAKKVKSRVKMIFNQPKSVAADFIIDATDLWKAYIPKPYTQKVDFFKAKHSLSVKYGRTSPELRWRELVTGELEIHEVPGTHIGILEEPNVEVLAGQLQTCIDKALL